LKSSSRGRQTSSAKFGKVDLLEKDRYPRVTMATETAENMFSDDSKVQELVPTAETLVPEDLKIGKGIFCKYSGWFPNSNPYGDLLPKIFVSGVVTSVTKKGFNIRFEVLSNKPIVRPFSFYHEFCVSEIPSDGVLLTKEMIDQWEYGKKSLRSAKQPQQPAMQAPIIKEPKPHKPRPAKPEGQVKVVKVEKSTKKRSAVPGSRDDMLTKFRFLAKQPGESGLGSLRELLGKTAKELPIKHLKFLFLFLSKNARNPSGMQKKLNKLFASAKLQADNTKEEEIKKKIVIGETKVQREYGKKVIKSRLGTVQEYVEPYFKIVYENGHVEHMLPSAVQFYLFAPKDEENLIENIEEPTEAGEKLETPMEAEEGKEEEKLEDAGGV